MEAGLSSATMAVAVFRDVDRGLDKSAGRAGTLSGMEGCSLDGGVAPVLNPELGPTVGCTGSAGHWPGGEGVEGANQTLCIVWSAAG